MIIELFSKLLKQKSSESIIEATASTFKPFLSNAGILSKLKSDYSIDIDSVFKLHKIMEKMGIIKKIGNASQWILTEQGRKAFTSWKSHIINPNLWHPDIVNAIAKYIKENNIDVSKINKRR